MFNPSILESSSFNLSIIHDIALGMSSKVMFFSLIIQIGLRMILLQKNIKNEC